MIPGKELLNYCRQVIPMLLDEDIELVKSQISMRDIAGYYGMRVNRKGYALCPFHNDKHPSMQVFSGYTSKDGYYCRSCGAGGTIFNFVMEYENLTFEESVRLVANAFGISISAEKEWTPDDRKRLTSQRMRAVVFSEAEKNEQQELSSLAETIRLFQDIMKATDPYSDLFCAVGNILPVLQEEWDERFQKYCDGR